MINPVERRNSPPPGIWDTLKAGFELTTRHLWILAVPIMLDCFYWLGPRLGVADLAPQWLALMRSQLEGTAPFPETIYAQIQILLEQWNLFTQISLPLLGVPAMMGGMAPAATPIAATFIQLESAGQVVWLLLILAGVGLLLGAVYYTLMSSVVAPTPGLTAGRRLPRQLLGMFLMALSLIALLIVLYIPFAIMTFLAALIEPGLAAIVGTLFSLFLLWVLLFLSFTLPAMFLQHQWGWRALLASARFMQQHLIQALPLALLVVAVTRFQTALWRMADNGSWLTLISIFGHAFIATALMSALFIFYRDRLPTPRPAPSPQL